MKKEDDDSEDDEDVIEMDLESPYRKVKPFKEAIKAYEDVNRFVESCGHVQVHSLSGSVIDEVTGLKVTTSRQTTIHNFLPGIN